MPKYEIWGDDEAGKFVLLGYITGDLPETSDTILVRGEVRDVEKVWRHHAGVQILHRVRVGPVAGGGANPEKSGAPVGAASETFRELVLPPPARPTDI
jgi:hypothetical protein